MRRPRPRSLPRGAEVPRHKIDLEQLQVTIDAVTKFSSAVDADLERLSVAVEQMQVHWNGDAAAAQLEAHSRWVAGVARMQEALENLRQAARTAHGNYQGVGDINTRMWP